MRGAGRKLTLAVAVTVLGGSMFVAVRRSAEVREIAREIESLEAQAAELRERRPPGPRTP